MANQTTNQYPPGYLEESRQSELYTLEILFMILETVTVALRFTSRRIGRVPWHRDDTLITVSWIVCMCFNSLAIGMSFETNVLFLHTGLTD